jgi:hypothetical protein
VDGDVHLVSHLYASEIHERGVKHQTLRVANFGDRLGHGVKLCLTPWFVKFIGERAYNAALSRGTATVLARLRLRTSLVKLPGCRFFWNVNVARPAAAGRGRCV